MTKIEILVLIVTIFVSVTLLSFFLDKVFKTKGKEKEHKKETEQEKIEDVEKVIKEEKQEEKKEVKKSNKEIKAPPVSIALQDELNQFKEYLKTRITPEMVTKEEHYKHPYDTPHINRYNDFDKDFYDLHDEEDFPFRKKSKNSNPYENLPDEVKILLFTNFFDTKF